MKYIIYDIHHRKLSEYIAMPPNNVIIYIYIAIFIIMPIQKTYILIKGTGPG